MNRNYGEAASFPGRLPVYFFMGLVLAGLLGTTGLACSRQRDRARVHSLSCETDDGFTLATTVYVPDGEHPPGIILLHRYGGSREVWESVASTLQQQGIMALTLDLRGHGQSRTRHGEAVHYRQLPDDAWLEALADVRAAKKILLAQGVAADNLAVAGEGMGASLALHYALDDSDMQAVVMISPGLETQGIPTEAAIKQLEDCPTLLFAGEGDAYAAMSAAALKNAAPVYSELRTWAGGAHGVDLMATHPEATEAMLLWLRKIIAPE